MQVAAWSGLPPKLADRGRWTDCPLPPIVAGTVIRVQVEHLPGPRGRAVKTLWLWWAGAPAPRTCPSAGGPTSAASTSSTPSASASRRWAGPPASDEKPTTTARPAPNPSPGRPQKHGQQPPAPRPAGPPREKR